MWFILVGPRAAKFKDYIRDSGRLADWPIDPDGAYLYPGLYRDITTSKRNALMWEDTHYAWRLNMEKAHALAQKKNDGPIFLKKPAPKVRLL